MSNNSFSVSTEITWSFPLLSSVCMMHTYVYNVCDNECDNECEHHGADCTEVGESLRCQFLPSFYLV